MKNPWSRIVLACTYSFVFFACGGDDERFEEVLKLRSIGTSANPPWLALDKVTQSQAVEFDFYSVVPKGTDVTAQTFTDSAALKNSLGDLEIVETKNHQELGSLTIVRTRARVTIPASRMIIPPGATFASLRYAIKIVAGTEEEKVVGNYLVYATDPWPKMPSVAITTPTNGQTIAADDVPLKAEIVDQQNERYKVGWFVSSGKIRNRRAISTKISEIKAGTQSLVVTLRGLQSGVFVFHAVDVTVQ